MANSSAAILSALKKLEGQLNRIRRESLKVSDLNVDPTIFLRGTFENFDVESQRLEVQIDGETLFYPISYYESQWLPMPGQQVTATSSATGAPLRARSKKEPGSGDAGAGQKNMGCALLRGFGRGGMSIPPASTELYRVQAYMYAARQLKLANSAGAEIVLSLPEAHREYYETNYKYGDPIRFRIIDVPPTQFFVPLAMQGETSNVRAGILQLLTESKK